MRLITTVLLSMLGLCLASHASADATATVIVLGLRSVEGDDDVANSLTDSLRDAVHDVPVWQLSDRSVSMTQMSLAHDCDEIDAACLSDIAKGLQVELIVYGTLRRTSARSEYDYQLALSLFNANTGSIGATENDVLPRVQAEQPGGLAVRAQALIRRLANGSSGGGGSMLIQVNTARAEVRIDGQIVGQTENGQLVIEGVPAGEHEIEINAVGRGAYSQRVMVSGTGQTNVSALLPAVASSDPAAEPTPSDEHSSEHAEQAPPPGHGGSMRWLGYTLLGVGGASVVGAVASMLAIENINGDKTYQKYQSVVGNSIDDICAEAETGNMHGNGTTTGVTAAEVKDVASMCSKGSTFEVLQWVFIGGALLSGGLGTYILVTDKKRDQQSAQLRRPSLAFSPEVGRSSFKLSATLSF